MTQSPIIVFIESSNQVIQCSLPTTVRFLPRDFHEKKNNKIRQCEKSNQYTEIKIIDIVVLNTFLFTKQNYMLYKKP